MLLNGLGFGLVMVLGFLPLIVVQWADWHPLIRLPRASQLRWSPAHSRRVALFMLVLLLWLLFE